jgi:2,5-diketo-D-gluconate reductase A
MRINLNDGRAIPQLGLGLWQTSNAAEIVAAALETGYRHFDTAAIYGNEAEVGQGLRAARREDIFVTTKVWNDAQGFDSTLKACRESLTRLSLDYVDLYLVHWPAPRRDLYVDTWRALIRLREEGLARSIGVSNFEPEHIERIVAETGVTPAINQIELHPRFQQNRLRDFHAKHGIATESWAPLGRAQVLSDPVIAGIASKHARTPAQVVVRWHMDEGLVVIPKTSRRERLRENFAVFDFALDAADLAAIAALDSPQGRIGPSGLTATF